MPNPLFAYLHLLYNFLNEVKKKKNTVRSDTPLLRTMVETYYFKHTKHIGEM